MDILPGGLRVEFLLKTESGYLRDAEVTLFTLLRAQDWRHSKDFRVLYQKIFNKKNKKPFRSEKQNQKKANKGLCPFSGLVCDLLPRQLFQTLLAKGA